MKPGLDSSEQSPNLTKIIKDANGNTLEISSKLYTLIHNGDELNIENLLSDSSRNGIRLLRDYIAAKSKLLKCKFPYIDNWRALQITEDPADIAYLGDDIELLIDMPVQTGNYENPDDSIFISYLFLKSGIAIKLAKTETESWRPSLVDNIGTEEEKISFSIKELDIKDYLLLNEILNQRTIQV